MKKLLYETIKAAEDSWWYRGRSYALSSVLRRYPPIPGEVLDFGAGYGAMFSFLRDFGPVSAYEVYPPCVAECRRRGYVEVFDSDPSIFSQKSKFALIGAFDVLEHIENDVDVLSRLYGAIRPGGIVVATVPAHQFLWSSHDVLNHHFRRHSKASLQRLFEESGFEVVTISYWNCLLFPLAACMRLLGVGGHETLMPSHAVNILLTRLLYLESLLLSFVPLPMGLSLVVVARRTV